MTDQFKQSFTASLPEGTEPWNFLDRLKDEASAALKQIPGVVKVALYHVASDETKIERDRATESIAVLESMGLKPTSALAIVKSYRSRTSLVSTAEVFVSVRFHEWERQWVVTITAASESRVHAEWLFAAAKDSLRLLEKMNEEAAQTTGDAPVPVHIAKVSVPPALAAMPAPSPEPSPGWLRRTWRDHVALFVVTVVGGLVVIYLAVHFGLSASH